MMKKKATLDVDIDEGWIPKRSTFQRQQRRRRQQRRNATIVMLLVSLVVRVGVQTVVPKPGIVLRQSET